ncbi:Transcriptional regulator [hydrothermal vent metagenome]|uniref:Transcriptional regulator n=1 Tax=hydrothermal vent metagenome TaxID=652676 RepID=A0A3B0THP3_9ZZZZ
MAEAKIFAGPRIRRIRNRLGLSQTAMAGELGISPSYLNLIERNQRPLTVQILLKLAATYDIDIGALQGEAGGEVMERLGEVFSDPLLASELPSPAELVDIAESAPNAVSGLIRLYGAYRETTGRLTDLSGAMARGETAAPPPRAQTAYGEVASYFEAADPWVPELEDTGARIAAELRPRDDMFGAIKARLRALHSIDLRILPAHALPLDRARFDRHSHRIFLSESLSHEEKTRFAAIELALLGEAALLDALAGETNLKSPEAERLARLTFARKLAGAILMPASRFLRAAAELRCDIVHLAQRFGVAADRAMERLATARDPEAAPAEFAFLALDASGNIETRIPGAGFSTPRFGALCARLPVFDPTPSGHVISAEVETPDRTSLIFVATVTESFAPPDGGPPPRRLAALVMGTEAAAATVYAPGGAATPRPIGTTCRLCERRACPARTMPAATRPAALNEYALGMSDYDPA